MSNSEPGSRNQDSGSKNLEPESKVQEAGGNVVADVGFKGELTYKVIRHRRNTWWYKLFTLSFLRR